MHTHQSSLIRAAGRRPAHFVSIMALLVVTSLVYVASAHAADGSQFPLGQYGEVPSARFGGFDSTWYNGGEYNGGGTESAPTPGEFLSPVGFAVDTSDSSVPGETAIYVLDRVSAVSEATTEPGTRWRLQKLTDAGTPVALTEFFLPKTGPEVCSSKASTVQPVGLAISGGDVYTVLTEAIGSSCNVVMQAKEIVAWSTTPSSGELVAASGAADQLSSPVTVGPVTYPVPSLVSSSADLASPPIYDPRGLTADGSGSLAVLGDANDHFVTGESTDAPALAVQVSTTTGGETANWSSASFGLSQDQGDSISTDPNGNLDLILNGATASAWDLVKLSGGLTSPQLLASEGQNPPSIYGAPFNMLFNVESPAGPHGVPLSNGLYASILTSSPSLFWNTQEGIRLISPLQDGTLSSATGPDTVYDTLAQSGSGACDIAAGGLTPAQLADVVLAPGKDGSFWMFNAGKNVGANHPGRIVAEFAPNAADPCAAPPTGTTFSLTDEQASPPTPQLASAGPLTVAAHSSVRFSTNAFEYPTVLGGGTEPAAVFEFEWDPAFGAANDPGFSLVSQESTGVIQPTWPAVTPEYTYTEAGTYTVKFKALGELGEYETTGTVIVEPASTPTAAFTLPGTAQAGQSVPFDATASQPGGSSTITNYHWDFGDGHEDETQSKLETHAYAAAGTYTVTLIVGDADNQQSTPVTHQITVTAPPSNGSGTGTTTPPPSSGTPAPAPPVTTPKPTPTKKPTPAATAKKKLAAALKVCKKKPANKRAACEKQARAKYSGKSKKK
jgi:PKD repeat protein